MGYSPSSLKLSSLFNLFDQDQFSSIAVISPSQTGCATNASVSEIKESRVLADQPAPIPPIHTATSYRTYLLPPSLRIAVSDMPIRPREVAAMEAQLTIGDPDVVIASIF